MRTILFFSWTHLWSMKNKAGAPSYHHTIKHYLNSDDWDVHLFSADLSNQELSGSCKNTVHIFESNKFIEKISTVSKINHLGLMIRHRLFTKWAVKSASEIIEKTKGEIVVYAYEVWGVEPARILSERYSLPLITRFQGTVLTYCNCNLINRLRYYPHYGALETKADLVIMTDDGTKGNITLKRLGNESPVLFIRNGLDLYEKYELIHEDSDISEMKRELGISENDYILLMASRLESWKRVDRGLRAMAKVLEKRDDVLLLIAGDGPCRKDLDFLTDELDIRDHVIFLGSVPQSDLYRYMLCADVFLSLYDMSNLGNPLFEAMLMKNAVIALNGGSTSSVVHNDENGILLEYSEESKIPEKIEKLISDEKYRNRLADGAYRYAVTNFYSWEDRMKTEENQIIDIIQNRMHHEEYA